MVRFASHLIRAAFVVVADGNGGVEPHGKHRVSTTQQAVSITLTTMTRALEGSHGGLAYRRDSPPHDYTTWGSVRVLIFYFTLFYIAIESNEKNAIV